MAQAIGTALVILGRWDSDCPANSCPGCKDERWQAMRELIVAVARHAGEQCRRCNGDGYVAPAEDSPYDADLCPDCDGRGVRDDFDAVAACGALR